MERDKLAPYAAFSGSSRGRKYPEEPSTLRTDFQRDRDRVIHSTAFRRMEYKTQVFVNHEGDHYRTRLTHSLEVSQVARTVARALALNEDLTEALVLAHDIGHTPFGHAGERVMTHLMKEHGAFEHNKQSLRIVDVLEHPYPSFPGLNLTYEVREGIAKHSAHWKPESVPKDLDPTLQPTLEAQLIDTVDEIAYNNHDIDDGVASGLLDMEALEEVPLWKDLFEGSKKKHPGLEAKGLKRATISSMISCFVGDLVETTAKNVKDAGIEKLEDLRNAGKSVVSFSNEVSKQNQVLKKFLWDHLYTHFRVVRMEEKAKRILTALFQAYMNRPQQLPLEFRERMKSEPQARIICDYMAGMTDRFAVEEHQKLFDPQAKV